MTFTINLANDIPKYILIDEPKLRRILINLIGNSVKFTHSGFIEVKVACTFYADSNSSFILNISVTDSGIGIPKDQQKQIFDSFEQVKG